MSFCVRAAQVEDLAVVVALERAVAEAPHWAEGQYAAAVGGESGMVRRCLFVAEAEGAIVGFSVGKIIGDIAELESVAVASRMRRSGIGRALCEAVIHWSESANATLMELEVRAASGAIALYKGLGFVAVGRRPRYYKEPTDDAVLMQLDLSEIE